MTNLLSALPSSYNAGQYGSGPVIPYAPNADADRSHQWDWSGKTDAIPSGLTIANVTPTQGTETFTLQYVGLTRADVRAIEAFVEARSGRFYGFWCPTFQHDFYVSLANAQLRDWGYATKVFPLNVLDGSGIADHWASHFAAWYAGQWGIGQFLAAIDESAVDSAGFPLIRYSYTAITGTDGLTGNTTPGGLMLGRCLWVRFAEDAMTTEWVNPMLASVTLRVVTIPSETPRF